MTSSKGIVREIAAEQVKEAAVFAWAVYQDETKRTSPPYRTLEKMIVEFQAFFDCKTEALLGYFEDDQLMGVMPVIIEHGKRYCSSGGGPYIENEEAYFEIASAFMAYLEEHCRGYMCYFGTTKPNIKSQKFLESRGFTCTEDTVQMRVEPSYINAVEGPYLVQLLTEDDYELYRQFHTEHFSEYYWTAEKIFEVKDQWHVAIVKIAGEIVGNAFTLKQNQTGGEVYGAMVLPQYENTEMLSQLYYESVSLWFEKGLKEIVNFVPEGHMLDAAKRVGFVAYDTYMCYCQKELLV